MKTIGILGGMSAASTQIYYRKLCELTAERLGGLNSPELLIRSLNFHDIEALQAEGRWDDAGALLNKEAKALEAAGAQLLILASNTMHKLADAMMKGVCVPFLHIAEATAQAIKARGLKTPALMATRFTMEQAFYSEVLIAAGLQPITPDEDERRIVHRIIYEELCRNVKRKESEAAYVAVARKLVARGADSVILGCTEIGMLLNDDNVPVPVFDTTAIHCEAALEAALRCVSRLRT